ncbi:MAG TPA: ATP-binding protein [Vicinamibacterales bacterium]|jgi:signal transduction histidine kinase
MSDLTGTIGLHSALVRWFSEISYAGVFATDRDLRVIVWNRWMEIHAARRADDVLGHSLLDLFPDLTARGLDQSYREALAGHVSVISHGLHGFVLPLPATHPDVHAAEMPQSGRIAPLLEGETVIGTVTTIEDVSDRLASEGELRRQISVQQAARLTAEQALRAKDEFLSVLSHEMRTPLNAVLGWTRILMEHPDADRALLTRALQAIARNAEAQTRMIDDLLDIARVASGKIRLEMQPLDIIPVALAAIDGIAPAARAKQIELRTSFDAKAPWVLGDAARLQQVVWNLLSNALKFTGPGGAIEVAVAGTDGRTRLLVRDSGEGISREFLPFVFDRFRQSDTSSARRHGGLGLGLALVREIVELHGGRVTAASDGQGRGSAFMVDLPGAGADRRHSRTSETAG